MQLFSDPCTDSTEFVEKQLKISTFRSYCKIIQPPKIWQKYVFPTTTRISCVTSVCHKYASCFWAILTYFLHQSSQSISSNCWEMFGLAWSRIFDCGRPQSRTCEQCQKVKAGRHTRTPVDPLPSPDKRFEHIHIDITSSLPHCEGDIYIYICWRASIVFLVGAKSFQWLILVPIQQRKHSYQVGCPVSVFQLSLPRIGVNSSNQVFSANWWNFYVVCSQPWGLC